MAKYVKVEDVIELIKGLESLPWEEEVEELVYSLPIYDTDKDIHAVKEGGKGGE